MAMHAGSRLEGSRGVGKLEFLVLVAVIGIAAQILLERLEGLELETERTEVDLTIRNIGIGIRLAVGEKLMRGQEDRLPELLQANPIAFLGRVPRDYGGEGSDGGGPGSWHYDPDRRQLVYRPRQPEAFGGRDELRWQTRSQGKLAGRIAGIRLESATN